MVTHHLMVAENCMTYPLHKAQNLMTHPPLWSGPPPPILFDQSLNSGRMLGLVYSLWKRVTTSHHGSQISLFLLLTGTVFSLVHADSLHVLLEVD